MILKKTLILLMLYLHTDMTRDSRSIWRVMMLYHVRLVSMSRTYTATRHLTGACV